METLIGTLEYKGYSIQEDHEYCGWGNKIMFYPTNQGIQHDADYDGERYKYKGNCKWVESIGSAKEEIDDLGYATHVDHVKRFKKFYYKYLNFGGTMSWKEFVRDNRFPH